MIAPRLQRRLPAKHLLRAGLIVETLTHLVLAITGDWLVASAILVVFGVHTTVWGTIVITMRQRVVPDGLLGRVTSAYLLLDLGGAALGSLLGGLVATALGVTGPFWIAAGVMVAICVAAWRPLRGA
ncbi:MFS transporter [Kibdelosporangium aridum]|uniref:MFS transporter n=1 Tax=Kibdelosporangium aridum TaxID=2030 RepID=UPI0035E8EBC3